MSVPIVANSATVSFSAQAGMGGAALAVEVAGISGVAAACIGGVAIIAVVAVVWWACSD